MLKKISFKNVIIFSIFIIYTLSSVAAFILINNFFYNNIRQKFLDENKYSTGVALSFITNESDRLVSAAKQITENNFVFNVFKRNEYLVYSRALSDKSFAMKSLPVNSLTLKMMANELHRNIFGYHGERIKREIEIYNNKLELISYTGRKPSYDSSNPPKYLSDALGTGKSLNIELGVFDITQGELEIKGVSLLNYYEEKYAVAVVKEKIDGFLLDEIKKITNREVIICKNNRITDTTLFQGDVEIKNIEIKEKIDQNKTYKIKINNKSLVFNFFSINDYNGKNIAYIGVGFDSEQVESMFKKSMQKVLIVQIFFLSVLLIMMYILFKLIFKPLRKLVKIMAEIADGNYSGKVNIKVGKDLVVLGEGIETLSEKVKQRELELKNTMEELNKSREKLLKSEKMVMLGELASSINHEVKNPLGSILTNVGLLKLEIDDLKSSDTELLNEIKENIDAIDTAAKHAKKIIVNMLDLSRNDTVELNKVDLNNVVSAVSLIMKKELQKDNIVLKTIVEEGTYIKGHQGSLTQVVLNLIMNSRDAILEKNSADERFIKITLRKNEEFITLEVEDNGAGISDVNKERMFEAFFTTKEQGKGTGLGMSVSKTILDRHNAKVSFESVLGMGTKFTIQFNKASAILGM